MINQENFHGRIEATRPKPDSSPEELQRRIAATRLNPVVQEPRPSLDEKEFLLALVMHFSPEAKVSETSTEQELVREILRSKDATAYFMANHIPLNPRGLEIIKPGETARRLEKQRTDMIAWGFNPSLPAPVEHPAWENKDVLVAIVQHFDPNTKFTKDTAELELVRGILRIPEAVQWILNNYAPPEKIRMSAAEVEQLVTNVKEFVPDRSNKDIAVRMRKPQPGGPAL